MNAIRARLMGFGAAVVFVGTTRVLQSIGVETALEDCMLAATLATVAVAIRQLS